jgi:large repetitive protein
VLYGATGAGALGTQVQSTLIDGDAAATFTVPGKETTDPQGRYFMAVSSDGCSAAGQPYSFEPEAAAEWVTPALKVTTLTLKKGTVNVAYSATIGVSEGKKPYTFTAETALPPGLSLATSTGVISGKPAQAGKFTMTIKITDSTTSAPKSVTSTFTINIAS